MNLLVQPASATRAGADVGVSSSPVFAAARLAYAFVRRQVETVTALFSLGRGDFRDRGDSRPPRGTDRRRS